MNFSHFDVKHIKAFLLKGVRLQVTFTKADGPLTSIWLEPIKPRDEADWRAREEVIFRSRGALGDSLNCLPETLTFLHAISEEV